MDAAETVEMTGRLLHLADALALAVEDAELDLDTAAYCREAVVEVRRILGDAVTTITAAMTDQLEPRGPGKRHSTPLGTHERKSSTLQRSEWDPDLPRKVLARILEDDDLGLLPAKRRMVVHILLEALPASLSWRVGTWPKDTQPGTGLRGLGFDPADWCYEHDSGPGVQFTPSDEFRDRLYRYFAITGEDTTDDHDRAPDERVVDLVSRLAAANDEARAAERAADA